MVEVHPPFTIHQSGTGSGTRTHTPLRAPDFESGASTNSAIPARGDRSYPAGPGRRSRVSFGLRAPRWGFGPDGYHVRQFSGALKVASMVPQVTSQVMDQSRIRNVAIIAHIDHGKSTLADRFLELCGCGDAAGDAGAVPRLDGARTGARGSPSSCRASACPTGRGGSTSSTRPATSTSATRSPVPWRRARGVILLVDAAQGIEAQTLANCTMALEHDVAIVAALNKVDLPAADPDRGSGRDRAGDRDSGRGRPADLGEDR